MGEKEQYANETEKARAIVNATMAEFGLTAAKEVDTDIAATPDSGEQKKETELLPDAPVPPIEETAAAHSSPQAHEVVVSKEQEEKEFIAKSQMLDIVTSELFGKYLEDDSINEICLNGNGTLFCEDIFGNWTQEKRSISYDEGISFAKALGAFNNTDINKSEPMLDATLHTGERVHINIPPVVKDNQVSIVIRKPSKVHYSLDDYVANQALDQHTAELLKEAVREGKNLVICGETGSGKTTFMKTLIDFIPLSERIITIEDTSEITFTKHKDVEQMFYDSDAKDGDAVTSATLLKACLRMKPNRIILAELRGGETYDFLNVISSGHNGTMTSCHAGSVASCFNRLVMMAMQNLQARAAGKDLIMQIAKDVIDTVVVFKREDLTPDKKVRHIVEMLHDGKLYKRDKDGNFKEDAL